MRNTLQYLYTILVFSGALTTSYLMISQKGFRDQTRTAQNIDSKETYRREAAFDSGVSKLFEVGNALSQFPTNSTRIPAVEKTVEKMGDKLPRLKPDTTKKSATGERAADEPAQDNAFGFEAFK